MSIADYERGKRDGERGPGGPDGLGQIALFVIVAIIAIPSIVAALISSLFMFVFVRVSTRSFSQLTFGKAYFAFLLTTCTYLVTAVVLALVQVWQFPNLIKSHEEVSIEAVLKYFYYFKGETLVDGLNLIAFHLLCVLLPAVVLRFRLKDYFIGYRGYGYSAALVFLLVLPSLFATFNISLALIEKYLVYK